MKLRRTTMLFAMILMILILWKPASAQAQEVPAQVTAYVGQILDLESKYGIEPMDSSNENVFNADTGECYRKGTSIVTYYDENYEDDYDDEYGEYDDGERTIIVKVVYNKNIRMVADCWWTSGSDKYFNLKLKNIAAKNLTIYSSGATYVDKYKKSRNRNLKLANGKSSVTIKPGKKQTIKFKCKKNKLNFYMEASYFKFNCKYNGKKYTIKIVLRDEYVNAYMKKGSKWTFIDTRCDEW